MQGNMEKLETTEICECGHKEDWHSRSTNRCHKCPCEKFKNSAFYCCKCQDFFKEPHNHSPQSATMDRSSTEAEDKEPSQKGGGSDNQTLSDKITDSANCFCDVIKTEDVKEFIKKLKKGYLILAHKPMGWSDEEVLELIDKLAGKDLIK